MQLQSDGVGIREITLRTGISRNSVRKYLPLFAENSLQEEESFDDKTLADKAYLNDSMAHDAGRLPQLIRHFGYANGELANAGVPAS